MQRQNRKIDAPGRVTISFPKQGKTEQAHAGEADINKIWARAQEGHTSDYVKEYGGRYGDATSLTFMEANVVIAKTNEMFDALPSAVRNRFKNSPVEFLDFVQDPENAEEMIKLKLANRPVTPPEPTVQKVEIVNTPTVEPKE